LNTILALTSLRDPEVMRANIINVVKDYLAVGINPATVTIFKQSDVPEHTELAWIFDCLVTVPFLSQAHAYKDKVTKGLEANARYNTSMQKSVAKKKKVAAGKPAATASPISYGARRYFFAGL
jgi:tryptophanyl-tRNA synthetase